MKDWNKFVKGSRNFLKNYIIDNRLESCVLGISGGIDSCISACLAQPVCKELNIPLIGRSLPTESNSPNENNIAELVGDAFCSDFKVISISSAFRAIHQLCYEGECKDHSRVINNISDLQDGNIKARLRMIYLRNLASMHKGVVIDNDNFTEWNLGFWTVGGDSPMDINLGLHYLWKTEIYELADYLLEEQNQSDKYQALLASIKLIPTDGNGVSNSDCEQFGLDNYEQVDDVLKTMYYRKPDFLTKEQHNNLRNQGVILIDTTKEILDKEYIRLIDSYNEQGVDKVMILHQNTAYKRKELPIKPTREELGL